MSNLSNLSKEELISLLQNGKTCRFIATRGKQRCNNSTSTDFGFCTKHKNTVQGKKAAKEYSEHLAEMERRKQEELNNIRKEVRQEELERMKQTIEERPVREGKRKPAIRKKVIRPNHWGRYEDTETHIVFDPENKCAYGVQDPSGEILALSVRDIEKCKINGWNYISPDSDEESYDLEEYNEEEVDSDYDSSEEEDMDESESVEESEESDTEEEEEEFDEYSEEESY